ncbi:restriction endonuclease BglII [Sulfurifustis variabilis]|uniref:Restriction endonuclease BglII n=1 Tax=Sulfurifustis variabilis TaxID=1675686 RepID=A0A1B4UZX6_9GAMM|nr:BglII/BstYI family type II restriction endonuclease [Sulfurifustis variabilis]BAU46710.1 restriction endonuclease BglII [Sulfurifustis variabilis]
MRIVESYSHLNGEEYLIVHHPKVYKEIKQVIAAVDASACLVKESKEKTMHGKRLYGPKRLNNEFAKLFRAKGWAESRYHYYVTTKRDYLQEMITLSPKEQKAFLISKGIKEPIKSYKQTDFVKDKIAIEVQFGKYAFVAFDLFVKHLLFYSGGIINVGVEVLPVKAMASDPKGGRLMSTGIAYYEGEVYNILRHGRNSPPVPLLILGIAP